MMLHKDYEAEIAVLKAKPCPACGWYAGAEADVDKAIKAARALATREGSA
jgi:hypothetical protein